VAMSDCVVCFMKVKDLEELMSLNPQLSNHINKLIGFRIKRIERRLESLIFKDAKTRIVEFIKDLGIEYGTKENGRMKVKNFLSHEDIAKITSTSLQTVTRVLNELKEQGKIFYNTKFFELPNE
jgi:CRP/FNR family transcriptional regulator